MCPLILSEQASSSWKFTIGVVHGRPVGPGFQAGPGSDRMCVLAMLRSVAGDTDVTRIATRQEAIHALLSASMMRILLREDVPISHAALETRDVVS